MARFLENEESVRRSASENRRAPGRRQPSKPAWASLSRDALLDLRIKDLRLSIEGTPLETRIAQVRRELASRGFQFRPHFWLSDEWFSPDGVPGVAIPFYLAHPRLMQLERKEMLEVEGGTKDWCMRILRHETGHAIDTAYRLRRRRKWRELFGKASDAYPDYYQPRPYSKRFVLHLDLWYAQSHPTEDFAETFAVWLKTRSRWKIQYRNWPALRKLEYVDEVMAEIRDKKAPVLSRERVEPVAQLDKTLREHYEDKRRRYGLDYPAFYDRELRRLFSDSLSGSDGVSAAKFLRKIRPELRRIIARWTSEYQYTIDRVLSEMIERSNQLNLRFEGDPSEVKMHAICMLTVQTLNFLHSGNHRIAL